MMSHYRSIFLMMMFSVALSGCSTIQRWFVPAIHFDLDDVQSVTIEDGWTGLSRIAPIQSTYTLTEENGAWTGSVQFSVGYPEPLTTDEVISIPAEAVQQFQQVIETATLYQGEYTPFWDHTDDYPSINITFHSDAEAYNLFTTSQGENNVPWGATVNGKTYVIDTDIPAQAYEVLQPYLKKDVLDALVTQAYNAIDGK